MSNLIQALVIFMSYKNVQFPTHCEHDLLMVVGIPQEDVSDDHIAQLERLHFTWNTEYECWSSGFYGSA